MFGISYWKSASGLSHKNIANIDIIGGHRCRIFSVPGSQNINFLVNLGEKSPEWLIFLVKISFSW